MAIYIQHAKQSDESEAVISDGQGILLRDLSIGSRATGKLIKAHHMLRAGMGGMAVNIGGLLVLERVGRKLNGTLL